MPPHLPQAIVKHGSMFCTMELLLRHVIQFLGLKGTPTLMEPGLIDDTEAFLEDMRHVIVLLDHARPLRHCVLDHTRPLRRYVLDHTRPCIVILY